MRGSERTTENDPGDGSMLPLTGIRILAFTQLGAGPYAMMLLGDLGAEIIKVEDPVAGGDEARTVPPHADLAAGDSLYFQSLNRGAKSLTLDLRQPAGRAVLRRLVGFADAVYNNMRGDLPARLGLDYASLGTVNPRLVCCSLTGFGRTGPRAADPAYDYLLQAQAGFMSVTGEPEGPPGKCGVSIIDFSGGILSALALVIGILRARETGRGCDVDVSLLDTAISMLNYYAVWNLNRGWQPRRLPSSAHQSLVPSQSFQTADGHLVVMCMKEKFWQRLCDCLGLASLSEDPHYRTFADRLEHRDTLVPLLEATFARRTTEEWLRTLRGRVPVAPVYTVDEALRDEQVVARDMIVDVLHPLFGHIRQTGSPIKIGDAAPAYRPAAALGANTDEVLAAAGFERGEIDALRRDGVI
jgi:crotonobetainyl-CoA:carnitine CoA-transferase CaiB-like acyl-CoA transferase